MPAFVGPAYLRDVSGLMDLGDLPTQASMNSVNPVARYDAAGVRLLVSPGNTIAKAGCPAGIPPRAPGPLLMQGTCLTATLLVLNILLDLDRGSPSSWVARLSAAQRMCPADPSATVRIPNAPPLAFGIELTCRQAFG